MTAAAAPPRHIQGNRGETTPCCRCAAGLPTDFAEPLATPAVTVPDNQNSMTDTVEALQTSALELNWKQRLVPRA